MEKLDKQNLALAKYIIISVVIALIAYTYGCRSASDGPFAKTDNNLSIQSKKQTILENGKLNKIEFLPSGAVFSSGNNTLQEGVEVSITETKTSETGLNPLGDPSSVYIYTISANLKGKNALDSSVPVSTLENPITITLPTDNLGNTGICYVGIRDSENDTWKYKKVPESGEVSFNMNSLRAAKLPAKCYITLYRLGIQIALFAYNKDIEVSKDITISGFTATSTYTVAVNDEAFVDDLNVNLVLEGLNLDKLDPANISTKITYRNADGENTSINVNGKKCTVYSESDKAVSGDNYTNYFFIPNMSFYEQTSAKAVASFVINLKDMQQSDFNTNLLIEIEGKGEDVVGGTFKDSTWFGFETVELENTISIEARIEENSKDNDGLALINPVFVVSAEDHEFTDGEKKAISEANMSISDVDSENIEKNWEDNQCKITLKSELERGKEYTLSVPEIKVKSLIIRPYELSFKTISYYTITYDLAEGSLAEGVTNPPTYETTSPIITLNNPTKDKHNFVGWVGTGLETASMTLTIPTGSTGDRKYTATWEESKFDLVLNRGEGIDTVTGAGTYAFGDKVVASCTMLDGYAFDKWTGDKTEDTFTMPETNVEMTANAKLIPYTIEYTLADGNYEEGITNPSGYDVTSNTITLNNPIREGYNFAGWLGTGLETASTTLTIPTGSTGDRKYTATWVAGKYVLTLNAGTGIATVTGAGTYAFGDKVVASCTMLDGYAFDNWTGDKTEDTFTMPKSNITMTANAKLIPYTIECVLAEGHYAEEVTNPTSYDVTSNTITLNNPKREGYGFGGWIGEGLETASITLTIPTGSTGNRVYTATWVAGKYVLTLNSGIGIATVTGAGTYGYGDNVVASCTMLPGYEFDNWTGDKTEDTFTMPESDVAMTANAKLSIYEISYEGIEGATFETENPLNYDVGSESINLCNPTKTGFNFVGWSGTELIGIDNKEVTINQGSIGDRTYIANWATGTYTLTLNAGEGISSVTGNRTYNYGDNVVASCTMLPGYEFDSWTGNKTEDTFTMPEENVTMTANAKPISYTIGYDLKGGNYEKGVSNTENYDVASIAITLNNPIREGYNFVGWSGTELIGIDNKEVTINQGSIGDRAYIANWATGTFLLTLNKGTGINNVIGGGYYNYNDDVSVSCNTLLGYESPVWTGDFNVDSFKMPANEVTMTVNASPITYNITYNDAFGTSFAELEPKTYTVEDEIHLTNPTKTGYLFDGWEGDGIEGRKKDVVISAGAITEDKTYTAYWTVEPYYITYDKKEGTLIDPYTEYNYETDSFDLVNPEKTGYEFLGWTEESEGGDAQNPYTISKGTTGNKRFIAWWKPETYTITYLDEDEITSIELTPNDYQIASDEITISDPVKDGYDFKGWTGSNGKTKQKYPNVKVAKGSHENKTYIAHWALHQYKITYKNLNDGSYDDGKTNPEKYDITSGTIELWQPKRNGYTFDGWTGSNGSELQKSVSFDSSTSFEDKTYTANWTAKTYHITYKNDDNGNEIEGLTPTTYTIEQDVTLPTPQRNGYIFQGWTGDGFDGQQTSVTIPKGTITEDKEYVAHWNIENYIITYNNVEGAYNPNKVSYDVATETFSLIQPTKDGYEFKGWSGNGIDGLSKTVTITKGQNFEDKTYTAHWEAFTYGITYKHYDNGNTITGLTPESYTVEQDVTLPTPQRNGYSFQGWTGDGFEGQKTNVTIAKGTIIGNKEYTAHWEPIPYDITYKNDDGSDFDRELHGLPGTYTIEDEDIVLPQNPAREGYNFMGWTYSGSNGLQPVAKIEHNSTEPKAFTAHWSVYYYAINYKDHDGTTLNLTPSSYTVKVTNNITLPTPSDKEGYNFIGWSEIGSDAYSKPYVLTMPPATLGDKTFVARRSAIPYDINYEEENGDPIVLTQTTYTIESGVINLEKPTKDGWDFMGWTGEGITEPTEYAQIPANETGDKTYIAHWNPHHYTITYDSESLAGWSFAPGVSNPSGYDVTSDTITLNNPSKDGYIFDGWTEESEGGEPYDNYTIDPSSTLGNKTFTAHWHEKMYNISYYNVSGAPEEGTNPDVYSIGSASIVLKDLVYTGYTFNGWAGSNGDVPQKYPNVTIAHGSTGDKHFTAYWDTEKFNITYLPGGENVTFDTNPSFYYYISDVISIKAPKRTGYTFTGWTGTGIDVASKTLTIPSGSTGDKTYTATWTLTNYKITLDLNGGTLVSGDSYKEYTIDTGAFTINFTITPPTGKTFDSWNGLSSGITGNAISITVPAGVTGNKTFKVNWVDEP